MADVTKFGEQVRQLRTERGFSLRELAEKAEVSPSQLSKIENGLVKNIPTEEVVGKLAYALNVSKDELKITAGYIGNEILEEILNAQSESAASMESSSISGMAGGTLGAIIGSIFGPMGMLIGGALGAKMSTSDKKSFITEEKPDPPEETDNFTEEELNYIMTEVEAAYDIAVKRVMFLRKRGDNVEYVQQIGRPIRTRSVRLDSPDVE